MRTPKARTALLPALTAAFQLACSQPKLDQDGDGFTELTGDCDDLDANVHPDAQEVCYNGKDDNCNGEEDEEGATSGRTWYIDLDGDGYGQNDVTVDACEQPDGYSPEKWDCHDNDNSIHPAAAELCDYIDNDCDGQTDENTSTDAMTWYPDGDGDGYGDEERAFVSCHPPADGWIAAGGDCLDGDPLINPGQLESCYTASDDNCDGEPNEEDAFACVTFYADLDGDGFPGSGRCLCTPEGPYTEAQSTDCDDSDASIFPGAGLVDADWRDLDCDGQITVGIEEADIIFGMGAQSSNRAYTFSGGDLNGDGHAEVVVGGKFNRSSTDTRTYVADGASLSTRDQIHELSEPATTGYAHTVHDLNGDGYDDFIANALCETTDEGRPVAVFLGPLTEPDWRNMPDGCVGVEYNTSGSQSAREVRPGGHTSEGRATVLFPDPYRDSDLFGSSRAGAVEVLEWDPELGDLRSAGTVSGVAHYQYMGTDAASAGDIDGDGLDDLLSMNPGTATSDPFGRERSALAGSLEVYTELDTSPRTTVLSNLYYRTITKDLAGPGDFNGDGYADLAFSATDSDIYFANSGRVHILYGPFDRGYLEIAELDQQIVVGTDHNLYADCVRSIGDFDNDGRTDLLIGATGWIHNEETTGANFVVFGNGEVGNQPLTRSSVLLVGTTAGELDARAGACSSRVMHGNTVGDVNGDGLPDIALRAARPAEDDPDRVDQLFLFFGRER